MSIRFVRAIASCPYCDVQKHQIDTDEQHAAKVVDDAIARHVRETHADEAEAVMGS